MTPVPNIRAAALIRGKPAVVKEVFAKLLPELRGRAFTVTGLEGVRAIQRIRDTIATLPLGGDWGEIKQTIAAELADVITNRQAALTRAEILIRTHGFQAYSTGTYETAMADDATTHYQYLATEDDRVRDTHLALNGIILPKTDPFWDKHFPPWEYGCRCTVRPMTQRQVEAERGRDAQRLPENRLVMEGPVAQRLRDGQIIRGELRDKDGRIVGMGQHDVTPPSDRGNGSGYVWHHGDLRIPPDQLEQRYDPPVWAEFVAWAGKAKLTARRTVLEWLYGRPAA